MNGTILVVDDNSQNRLLMEDILTRHGFTVRSARDGAEGAAMARLHMPDLILMDILMPVMDGLEACRQLRADSRTREIKIVALSSNKLLRDDDDFFATGFDGYLDRSLDIRTLPEIVRGYLGSRRRPTDGTLPGTP